MKNTMIIINNAMNGLNSILNVASREFVNWKTGSIKY